MLDDVGRSLPALMEAEKLQRRAARVGFEWDDIEGAWANVRAELDELREATTRRSPAPTHEPGHPDPDLAAAQEEFGDVLFALVNVARYVGVDPEQSLRAANAKFRRRFRHIEIQAASQGKDMQQMTLEEMDALWDEAKEIQNGGGS